MQLFNFMELTKDLLYKNKIYAEINCELNKKLKIQNNETKYLNETKNLNEINISNETKVYKYTEIKDLSNNKLDKKLINVGFKYEAITNLHNHTKK